MKNKLLIFIALFNFLLGKISAQDSDTYWGRYSMKNKNHRFEFNLSADGITDLIIDSSRHKGKIEPEYLGQHGNTQLISFEYHDAIHNSLSQVFLTIVFDTHKSPVSKFIIATGFYLNTTSTPDGTGSFVVNNKIPLNMEFVDVPKYHGN